MNCRVREYAREAQFLSALADSTNSQTLMEIKLSVSAPKRIDPVAFARLMRAAVKICHSIECLRAEEQRTKTEDMASRD